MTTYYPLNWWSCSLLSGQTEKDTLVPDQHVSCQWFLSWSCDHSRSWKAGKCLSINQTEIWNLEILRTLSKELKWWTSWCRPYIPFWCIGRPVRILDLLGEQLLTEDKKISYFILSNNLSWCVSMLKHSTFRGKFVQMRSFDESVSKCSNLKNIWSSFQQFLTLPPVQHHQQ